MTGFFQQMQIDSHEALGVLNTLFEILAPSALRPVDMLLRSMFVTPSTMVSNFILLDTTSVGVRNPCSKSQTPIQGRNCPRFARLSNWRLPLCPTCIPVCERDEATVCWVGLLDYKIYHRMRRFVYSLNMFLRFSFSLSIGFSEHCPIMGIWHSCYSPGFDFTVYGRHCSFSYSRALFLAVFNLMSNN